jgi:chemotaxis protein MotB
MAEDPTKYEMEEDDPEKDVATPFWFLTYCDMVTLLLVFFVLMFSFTTPDRVTLRNFLVSLERSFGVIPNGKMVMPPEDLPDYEVKPGGLDLRKMNMFMENLRQFMKEQEMAQKAEVVMNEQGIVFSLQDLVVFQSNSAQLSDEGKKILDKLLPLVEVFQNQIEVVGHSDSHPVKRGTFADNWQLSGARALAVVKYFTGRNTDLEPRFSATAYSDHKPLTDNEAEQQKNRRIDIIFKRL